MKASSKPECWVARTMSRVSARCSSRLAPLIEYGFMAIARILGLRLEPLLLAATFIGNLNSW
jgi:hypothetical protein